MNSAAGSLSHQSNSPFSAPGPFCHEKVCCFDALALPRQYINQGCIGIDSTHRCPPATVLTANPALPAPSTPSHQQCSKNFFQVEFPEQSTIFPDSRFKQRYSESGNAQSLNLYIGLDMTFDYARRLCTEKAEEPLESQGPRGNRTALWTRDGCLSCNHRPERDYQSYPGQHHRPDTEYHRTHCRHRASHHRHVRCRFHRRVLRQDPRHDEALKHVILNILLNATSDLDGFNSCPGSSVKLPSCVIGLPLNHAGS